MYGVLVATTVVLVGVLWIFDRTAVRRATVEQKRTDHLLSRASEPIQTVLSREVKDELAELRKLVDDLPFRWEKIRDETRRFQGRAYHHVKRVRDSLAEHGLEDADIEDLAGELQLPDAESGGDKGVLPLRPDVEGSQPAAEESWQVITARMKAAR